MSLPPVGIPLGAMRFNSDAGVLEYFDGEVWRIVDTFNSNLDGGPRGITGGGETTANINYFNIASAGDATDYGDLTAARGNAGGAASRTRGIFAGGEPATDLIQYITIASTGNAVDFNGNLTSSRRFVKGCSNQTRALFLGGSEPSRVNKIDYMSIANLGFNAQDFGDLTESKDMGGGSTASNSIRGLIMGGTTSPGPDSTIMEFVTIPTLGNAVKFGDLYDSRHNIAVASNPIRAIGGGGSPSNVTTIQYTEMATLGNSTPFGDLTTGTTAMGSCASSLRVVWSGGNTGSAVNTMQYVSIATTGDAVDFGDLANITNQNPTSFSNAHGGLG